MLLKVLIGARNLPECMTLTKLADLDFELDKSADLSDLHDGVSGPDMHDILEDASCASCLGTIRVGDYVCWGVCYSCAKIFGKLPEFLS